MILFYLLLSLLIVSRLRYNHFGFYSDYLSFYSTNAVKGIFIALVFIKHVTPYIISSGSVFDGSFWNRVFMFIDSQVGQWIVAMFLFYSGYGLMESIRKKGNDYISSIPRKRILTTLINFDIAVLLFAIITLSLSKDYSIGRYLLSFIGWEEVGNSNWYIFVILLCYFITYICFRKATDDMLILKKSAFVCIGLLTISVFVLSFIKPSWWYDTMLCYGAGILYSLYLKQIETVTMRWYWVILLVLILLLVSLSNCPYSLRGIVNNVYCIIFSLVVVLLTMKVKFNNQCLIWLGQNLFPLYIYQRVPMIILTSVNGGAFVSSYPVLYAFACLLITLLFAHFYKYWAVKL